MCRENRLCRYFCEGAFNGPTQNRSQPGFGAVVKQESGTCSAVQRMRRKPIQAGRAHRAQNVGTHANGRIALHLQVGRCPFMDMTQHKLHLALGQQCLTPVQHVGLQLQRACHGVRFKTAQPTRHKGQRQSMCCGKSQALGIRLHHCARCTWQSRHFCEQIGRHPLKPLPSHSSSARTRRPNAGCVMWRSSAAREKLPTAANTRKSSSQEMCIAGALKALKRRKTALVKRCAGADHTDPDIRLDTRSKP